MKIINIELSKLKANPANPRVIKDDKFHKLVNSILCLPKMLEIRPIVGDRLTVLGGNQRLRAMQYIAGLQPGELLSRLRTLLDYQNKNQEGQVALEEYWIAWLDKHIVPYIEADELTDAEKQQFIIKDNASFGDWDWDALANEWDADKLVDWGVDTWQMDEGSSRDNNDNKEETGKEYKIEITCDNEDQIQQLYDELNEKYNYRIVIK